MSDETHRIVMTTMVVGIGQLTTQRAIEFHARLNMWERLSGQKLTPFYVVYRHIGLSTNVVYEAPGAWQKRIMDAEMRDRRRASRHEALLQNFKEFENVSM